LGHEVQRIKEFDMPDKNQELAKVRFPLEDDKAETLWAIPLGNNLYQLDNTPWLVYGISWQDVIEAVYEDPNSLPVFQRIVRKSGNRTLRVVLDSAPGSASQSKFILDKLIELGCSYEGATKKYIGINVPPNIDLIAITNFLIENDVQWEHADPTFEELHPSS
jgi:hypothetical protein